MEEKNSNLKKIFYSEWMRITYEEGITLHNIIDTLKEKFDVKLLKIDDEKIIWLEKKNKQTNKK